MWLGFLYLLLAAISAVYWIQGFEAYLCLTKACQYFADVFGRSLLLWGMFYYTIAATAVFAGWLKNKKKVTFTFLLGAAVGHFLLLALAWRATGYLCATCTFFFLAELVLLALAWWYKPGEFKIWAVRVSSIAVIAVIILLVVNPNFSTTTVLKPYSSEAELAPAGIAEEGKMTVTTAEAEGNSIQLDLKERSALFWAWWCPNCQKDLAKLVRLPEADRPYLILTGIEDTATDLVKAREKLQKASLENTPIYLFSGKTPFGIPSLLFWDEGTQTVRMH